MTRGFLSDQGAQKVRLCDISAEIRVETARAWMVTDGTQEVWLPKSQAEHNGDGTFTLPEWLAMEKGLI
jgi:hypothetical protein